MVCVSNAITQKLETMVEANDSELVFSKRKAINTLFPYAIFLEQGGQQQMINAILRSARVSDSGRLTFLEARQVGINAIISRVRSSKFEPSDSGKFLWGRVVLYISRLFEKRSPTSLNRIVTLISPYAPWDGALNNATAVSRWAAAVEAIPYTDEVGQNTADAFLQIVNIESLRPQISIEMWGWLQRRSSPPPVCRGLQVAKRWTTFVHISRLGDVDILRSYLLLVWTESFIHESLGDVLSLIREDFGGIGKESYREELMERLDHVLGRLDQAEDSPFTREAKRQYARLKEVLLELHRQ